jgi:RHS repeat-associated protein
MLPRRLLALTLLGFGLADGAGAADKNGVAPRAISLPSGPGSIQGLGESFQPQLNSGSGGTRVPIVLPRGTGGLTPELALAYDSGAGNGSIALGWSLSGLLSIRRNTDRGVPFYVDGPNGIDDDYDGALDNAEEIDAFTGIEGEELVELADGSFRAENEGSFHRYARAGAGWELRTRDGRRLLFGQSAAARIEDAGRVFEWRLERIVDRNSNAIDVEYRSDPASPAQKHPRRVRWGRPEAFFAAVFRYQEGRPDVFSSFRSGFEVKTSLRLAGIDVFSQGVPAPAFALRGDFDGDGRSDALIRRYVLGHDAEAHLSLLTAVTLFGADGVSSLPSQTFAYGRWTPPDDVVASIIRSRGAPAAGFESPSVELIDMNGDALPDLLSTAGSQHRVHVNLGIAGDGRLAWDVARPVDHAPTIDIASDRVHLADASSDGLSDLLLKATNTSYLYYVNTGRNAWVASPFAIRNTDTWPIWPGDGEGGSMSRSFDSDYSRSNDVLHTGVAGMQLWLLLPDGRFSRELRAPPLACDGEVFRFDLPGTQIADLNGDRLQDLAWIQEGRVVYFPSRGRGDFAEPVIVGLGRSLDAADIERADFSDVDGDGLADLTVVRPSFLPNGIVYWLNRFERGLDGPRSVTGLPAQQSGDALRWADMNGNGTTDIAISQAQGQPGEKILVVDLSPGGKPQLLERADNGLGLTVAMRYEPSTAQMVRAEAAGRPWTTRMPAAVTVVSSIVEDDGMSPARERSFVYRDPYYDGAKQEFRGFQEAETVEAGDASIPGKRTRAIFDTGRVEACFKGKRLAEEIRGDDGKLFARTLTTWGRRVLAEGAGARQVCFAFSQAVDEFIHEGEVDGIRVRTETDYDDYGNAITERRLGVLDAPGDEVAVTRVFDLRLESWLLDLLARQTTSDGTGRTAADQRRFHDARGNLQRQEDWLDAGGRWVATLRQRFDASGNVVESIDARGSRRSTAYDGLVAAWAIEEVVHLEGRELRMTAEYDLGFGAVTSSTDFFGQDLTVAYDALGRPIEISKPGGAGKRIEYHPASPVSWVLERLVEDDAGGTFDSYRFTDARGRPLGTKVEAEGGRWRFVEAKAYNARGLESRSWLPLAADTSGDAAPDAAAPHDAVSYDALGRAVRTEAASGSVTRSEHRPLAVAVFDGNDDGGAGSPDLRRVDGLGRVVAVEEHNGAETYLTRYAWSARGELESIVDALGNVKRFRFDSLGRLIEVDDPDRGLVRYAYDDAGNRVRREDAKGQVISYSYDAANRTLEKVHRGAGGADRIEASYHYDAPAGVLDFGDGESGAARHTAGRLAWVEDSSGEEHFSYDERGNVEWVLKRIRDPETGLMASYRTQRRYDRIDRLAEIVFPDNDRLRFVRGAGSLIARVDGGPGGAVIVAEADYAPSGRPLRMRFGNGVESSFEYDAGQRLVGRRTADRSGEDLIDEALAYDGDSNLVAVDDRRPAAARPLDSPRRRTARFGYDELHRLVEARYGERGGGGSIGYAYDALGNLLEQSTPPAGEPGHIADAAVHLGAVAYSGGRGGRSGRRPGDRPGPHAMTGTASGRRLAYDLGGNVIAFDRAVLDWDFEDRIRRYSRSDGARGRIEAEYVHDHKGRRVLKRVTTNGAREETLYPDEAFEVQNGSAAKYAILDGRRIARIHGTLDPTRERVERRLLAAGWNLIAAAVETSASLREVFGADAAFYEARGGGDAPLDGGAPLHAGKAIWVHAPAARLAAWRGRPAAAPAAAVSAGPLHAWPRLEPFRPAEDLEGSPVLAVYDASSRRWLRRDPALPAFLNDAPAELASAQAFWSPAPVTFLGSPAEPQAMVFYHQDHTDSTAAITDADGRLVEERSHYPFGAIRHRFQPRPAPAGGADYDFANKERDAESGFIALAARGYLDLAGVFLSPDPRYAEAASLAFGSEADRQAFQSFLADPQIGNLYAYALRNPLKYVDPSGLEVMVSEKLGNDEIFREAVDLFYGTKEGQRLVNSIESMGGRVRLGHGPSTAKPFKVDGKTAVKGGHMERMPRSDGRWHGQINVADIQFVSASRAEAILRTADALYHELRHAEGFMALWRRIATEGLGAVTNESNYKVHSDLDSYKRPSDDPHMREFQREIGLWRPNVTIEFGEITVEPLRSP